MKKIYEAPKAEKLEFDYADTIVASGPGIQCSSGAYQLYTHGYTGCKENPSGQWVLS